MLRKGYSVPEDFSWIENYKLIRMLETLSHKRKTLIEKMKY